MLVYHILEGNFLMLRSYLIELVISADEFYILIPTINQVLINFRSSVAVSGVYAFLPSPIN